MAGRRRIVLVVVLVAALAVAAGTAVTLGVRGGAPPPARPSLAQRDLALETRTVAAAAARVAIAYPTTPDEPAPVWSPSAFHTPLPGHQILGFVPYYSLGELTSADYRDATTIAYDGVEITAGGGLDEGTADPGWADLASPGFADLVADAHSAHDQVLLTAFSESQSVIASVTRHPEAGANLAQQLQPVLADDRLDGVDLDVEGSGKADRPGFVAFMRSFTAALHSSDPSAVVVLDVYPGSAGDASSFFDIPALAPLVDSLFVMAYDMYQPGRASPNAPLASPTLGLSDVQTLLRYTAVVKPSKLLLGVPFYGYDFTTSSSRPGAATTTPAPEAVTWQSIVAADHAALWDPASDTPWYAFKLHGRWHETYFDDPASIALKTALAAQLHLAGVGVWSLGMESGNTDMLEALLGGSPAKKLPLTSSAVMDDGPAAPARPDAA
jgi:chitinase